MSLTSSQRLMLLILMAVQFVNITDFMIVLPLAADLVQSLSLSGTDMGFISGAYKAAAGLSALISAFFLDRFPRRPALFIAFIGLLIGIFLTTIAVNFNSLLIARLISGLCTGPVTSLSIAFVIDQIPAIRRGYAMSRLMLAFPLSTIIGVPLALEISLMTHWRIAFIVLIGLGVIFAVAILLYLPRQRSALDEWNVSTTAAPCVYSLHFLIPVYVMTGLAMFTGFLIFPHLAIYLQYNLAYPREALSLLYLVGGIGTFIALHFAGKVVDQWGETALAGFSTLVLCFILLMGFVFSPPLSAVILIFAGFMMTMSIRTLAVSSFISSLPSPDRCAGFISFNSAIQHFASALGSILAAYLLTSNPDGSLNGMPLVALLALGLSLTLPFLLLVLTHYRDRLKTANIALPNYPSTSLISQEKPCP